MMYVLRQHVKVCEKLFPLSLFKIINIVKSSLTNLHLHMEKHHYHVVDNFVFRTEQRFTACTDHFRCVANVFGSQHVTNGPNILPEEELRCQGIVASPRHGRNTQEDAILPDDPHRIAEIDSGCECLKTQNIIII